MSGEGLHIGNGEMDIHPRGSSSGIGGNTNCRPVRQNKLNRRLRKGNGLTCPKIPIKKGGK